MTDIVERLCQPVMLHSNPEQTNAERREAAAEVKQLRALVRCLLDNNPNDDAADGVSVLDVWRKDARRALEPKP
jgi:hypothetical protein